MEHYRSTLAATAFAVFGLAAAAQIMHPGYFETQIRPTRVVAETAQDPAQTAAWVDPPALSRPAPARIAEAADIMAPRMTMALPPEATMARPVSAEMTRPAVAETAHPLPAGVSAQPERPRKVATVRHRALAQRGARVRQASLDRAAPDAPASGRSAVEAPAKPRIDPIGDIFRGLGFGRDG